MHCGTIRRRQLERIEWRLCQYTSVRLSNLDLSDDGLSRFAWLRERLRSPRDAVVTSWVPTGFEAYARMLHPVEERDGEPPIRWADVSRWSDVALDASILWHEVALPEVPPLTGPPWSGQGPREGSLSRSDALELVSVLSARSTGLCLFGVWEGYGGTLSVQGLLADELPRRVGETPVFELPWRSYAMFEGPVVGATCFSVSRFQSPNLWWPIDRSWCVASEIDLAWTYVAGSRSLIDELLSNPRIEALEVSPADSLHRQLPAWLNGCVSAATDEVIASGSTSVELALGTATVTLVRLSRRKSVLITRSERWGGWGGANIPITHRGLEKMGQEVKSAVEQAVLGLCG